MHWALRQHLIILLIFAIGLNGCASSMERVAGGGDLEVARSAIAKGGDVSSTWHTSPIHKAVAKGDIAMVRLLKENGAPLNVCYLDTDYPDYWNLDQSRYFHDTMPPLGSAMARANAEVVAELLKLGAPVEQECALMLGGDYQFSAIMWAAEFGDIYLVNLLLDRGSQINRLADGFTPLSIAAYRGHYDVARILLARGAFHSYSDDIMQPIEAAIDNEHEDVARLLVAAGATRPRQPRPFAAFEGIAKKLVKGVVVVGMVALIVEGSKYYGYDADYAELISSQSNDISRRNSRSNRYSSSNRSNSSDGCLSDLDCGGLEVCVKKPYGNSGICVHNPNARLDPGRDPIESVFPRGSPELNTRDFAHNCPLGTHWDRIYQDCVN